ncbi:hypothetical protein FS837_002953, partial [Tulasnella sp. UAMH 9824]
SEPGVFEGTDPKECEAFVAAVRRRALEQGKHRDKEWMAVFASSYLGGRALYWYEDLDEVVQNDWSRLRPALLSRFGRRDMAPIMSSSAPTTSASTSSTTIPTPAAAPPGPVEVDVTIANQATTPPPFIPEGDVKVKVPRALFNGEMAPAVTSSVGTQAARFEMSRSAPNISTSNSSITIPTPAAGPPVEADVMTENKATTSSPLVRKGHLKVLNSNGKLLGYIRKSPDIHGFYDDSPVARGDALLVSFTASADEPFEIQIVDAPQRPRGVDLLAIGWRNLTGAQWMDDSSYEASCCSHSIVTSKAAVAVEKKVWTISNNGELIAKYPRPDGGVESLQPRGNRDIWWAKSNGELRGTRVLKIVFEDAT